jgi:hypothetical protein
MSKIINTSAAPEKVKLPVRVKIVAGIALLVLVGIGAAASLPSVRQSVANTYSDLSDPGKGPCGKDRGLINSYNQAAKAKDFNKVGELAKTARQKAEYQTDSTCLYISVMGYVTSSDTKSGFKDYDALMKLVQAGEQPSRRIDDGINKTDFYNGVKKFEEEKPENPHGEG